MQCSAGGVHDVHIKHPHFAAMRFSTPEVCIVAAQPRTAQPATSLPPLPCPPADEVHLVPQLCVLHPVPVALWRPLGGLHMALVSLAGPNVPWLLWWGASLPSLAVVLMR